MLTGGVLPVWVAVAGGGAGPGRAGASALVGANELVRQLAQIGAPEHLVAVIGHGATSSG